MMYKNLHGLILASGSPRRSELLASVGISFAVVPSNIPEELEAGESPESMVQRLSFDKAAFVSNANPDDFVLAVDTDVIFEGEVFGKPASVEDAQRMLAILSGKTHKVVTAATLLKSSAGIKSQIISETLVTFRTLTIDEIARYTVADSVLDKAGAYGAQDVGQCIIEKIEGSFSAVIGLDLSKTCQLLMEKGVITVVKN